MSTLSALKVGDRVRPVGETVDYVRPLSPPMMSVGTIVGKTAEPELPPYLVMFLPMYGGSRVPLVRAFAANELRRMPTPGDVVEVVEDRLGCAHPPGMLGTVRRLASFNNETGDDLAYAVEPANDRRGLGTVILASDDFRIISERRLDVQPPRVRWPFWRGVDATYTIATFRDRRTGWKVSLEWKPADLWIGLYTQPKTHAIRLSKGGQRRHYWLAFLTLVVHFWRHYASE